MSPPVTSSPSSDGSARSGAPRTVLVTGATGLLGRSAAAALMSAGYAVLGATRDDAARLPIGCRPIRMDVREPEVVVEAVARSHVVLHLAAIVGNAACEADVEAAVDVNVVGTLNVLEAANALGKPVVFASVGNVDDDNPYAITKATAERFCRMFQREHGTRVLPLRIFNAYGPGQRGASGKLLATNVARALRGEDLVCHGDGRQVEDFVHVEDVSRALVAAVVALESGTADLEPADVGTGVGTTILGALELIRDHTGGASRIVHTPPRPGSVTRRLVARPSPFLAAEACLPLAVGIDDVIRAERATPAQPVSPVESAGARSGDAAQAARSSRAAGTLEKGRVLVTGGNGFIGTHVVERLLARGFTVSVLDRIGESRRADVEFILGDIRDRALVERLAPRFDGIVNLAAVLGTSETLSHPRSTVASNIVGALHVFEAARRHGCRVAQITVGNHWMNNPYAITKSAAERLAIFYNQRYGTRISVVRGLNAYGEWQKAWPVRKIIPNFVLPAIRDEAIVVYGDGEQRMDMIYVGDLAEILVRSLVLDHGAFGTVFEAGTGDAPTVNEIAERVVRSVEGTRVRITHVPMRQGEPERSVVLGDPRTLAPLGIDAASMTPLDEGLRRTVSFYRQHADAFS